MRRRDFLIGCPLAPAAALGLAGCRQTAAPRPRAQVQVTRAAGYGQDIYDTMRRVLAAHKLKCVAGAWC